MKRHLLFIALSSIVFINSQTLNPTPKIDLAGSSDMFKGGYTFAYQTSGTPWNGPLLSFGGFSNQYDAQLNTNYLGKNLSFRTRNGDNNTWNPWVEVWHSGNLNNFNTDFISRNMSVNGGLTVNSGTAYSFLKLGQQAHDNIIVDNSPEKHYGGGYFFRVTGADNVSYNEALIISESGNIGIGINKPQNKLDVNGIIHAKEVKVDLNGWADYVFKKDYDLPTLESVEKHIKEKGHLPNIPSEKEVLEKGINLGDNQRLLLQKIEELTLYSIEQNKRMKQQSERIENLELQLNNKKK